MDPDNATIEPVDATPNEADLDVLSVIDSIVGEMEPDFSAEDEPAAAPLQAGDEVTPEAPVEVTPAAVVEDPAVAKGLDRLVAREVEIRQREDQLKVRESELSSYQAKIAELEKQVAAYPKDLAADLATSPYAALKAAGHDPDQVIRLALAEKMQSEGKPIPEALQASIKEAQINAKLRELESKQLRYQQEQASAAYYAQIDAGAQQYVMKGEFKNAPTVALAAKANPVRIYQEIMDEITVDARSPGKDPKAAILSFEEAAARVERRYAELKSLFGGPAPGASTTAATSPVSKAAPTKPSVTATKPLSAPKTASLSEKEILDAIIRETEAEYRKASKPV